MRTEVALQGPRLHSLCVVLMSTFVATVAFQIHANRRPVLCVACHQWLPLLTVEQHAVAKHCDVLTAIVGGPKVEQTSTGHQSSTDHASKVPADKCYSTRVDVIIRRCSRGWPGDCVKTGGALKPGVKRGAT